MDDNYREVDVYTGRQGRTARFKKDQVNLYLTIYDENREDNAVRSYNKLMEDIGKILRKEFDITRKDLKKDGKDKDKTKNESLLDKDKGVLGSGD